LEGVDHRPEPPGLPLLCECLREALKPFGVRGHSAAVFLEDEWLGWRGPDDRAAPPAGSRAPGGPACIPEVLPQEQRCEPKLRGLESVDGIFTGPAQVPNGFSCHLGHIDRGEGPRAPQAGEFAGGSAVGFNSLSWFFGDYRGRDDPADLAFQRAGEPLPARACFIDKDEVLTFGLELTDEGIDVTLAGTDIPERDDLSVVFFGDIGNSNGRFVDSQSDVKRARLGPG
jgi:hypothetical protein